MRYRLIVKTSLIICGALFASLMAVTASSIGTATPAAAQTICYPGVCGDLWYRRNAIYANKGYCFQTARARSVFGRRCYPPYGRLTAREQRRVARIQSHERRCGCN